MTPNDKKIQAEPKLSLGSKIMLVFMSALLAFIGALGGSLYQGHQQIKMQKYILMTQFHCRTAELFAEAESVAGDLIHKYGLDKVQNADIPQEDVDRYNQVIKQLNTQIWSMFLIMPDESYGNIMRAIPSGVLQLKDVRGRLLCGMRKAQFPRTAYATPESIRLFYYLEKQETPNQGVKRTGDPLRGSPAAHP